MARYKLTSTNPVLTQRPIITLMNGERDTAREKEQKNMSKIKAYYIDTQSKTAKPVEIEDSLDTYYDMLHCTCIDIVNRRVGRHRYDIICDDEGLLTNDTMISAIDNLGNPMLCGSLLIVGNPDDEGNVTSLTATDIAYICKRVVHLGTRNHPEGWMMLTQCEY